MKSTPDYNETFRQQYLSASGLLGPLDTYEELRRARFFIGAMEQFIQSSETDEVAALEVQAQSLSEEAKDEYWQWNYPVHWQDIFGVRIRSAFLVQLCSHIEALLANIAHRIQAIERCAIKPKQLNGSTLEKHRVYIEAFGKFEGPASDLWKKIGFLFRIRNAHIHQQGYAGDLSSQKEQDFRSFLETLPNVSTQNDFIELRAGSCSMLLDIAERFHKDLVKEYEAYRQRALRFATSTEHR